MLQFFLKAKNIHKIASRNSTIIIPIKFTSCISSSSTNAFLTKDHQIDGLLLKLVSW